MQQLAPPRNHNTTFLSSGQRSMAQCIQRKVTWDGSGESRHAWVLRAWPFNTSKILARREVLWTRSEQKNMVMNMWEQLVCETNAIVYWSSIITNKLKMLKLLSQENGQFHANKLLPNVFTRLIGQMSIFVVWISMWSFLIVFLSQVQYVNCHINIPQKNKNI